MPKAKPKFQMGESVEKISGYKWPGIVVECTVPEVAGALHIYSESQLERRSALSSSKGGET